MTRELARKLLLFGLYLKTDARCGRAPSGSQGGTGPTLPDELLVSLAGLTTMALHGRIEVFDQFLGVERLTQEAGCSGFQCLRPDILLGESRDEDDRQPVSLRLQKILQLDSAHARHMNIRDHAGGVIQLR